MANTKLKRAARARQKQTGERYTEALARVKQELDMNTEESNDSEFKSFILAAVAEWMAERDIRYVWRADRILFTLDDPASSMVVRRGSVTFTAPSASSMKCRLVLGTSQAEVEACARREDTRDLLLFELETLCAPALTKIEMLQDEVRSLTNQVQQLQKQAAL